MTALPSSRARGCTSHATDGLYCQPGNDVCEFGPLPSASERRSGQARLERDRGKREQQVL